MPILIRGDIIRFLDELYIVIENHGNNGKVMEYFPEVNEYTIIKGHTGMIIDNFLWEFQGVRVEYAGHIDI